MTPIGRRQGRRWLALALACGMLTAGACSGDDSPEDARSAGAGQGGLQAPRFADGDADVVVSTSIGDAPNEDATSGATTPNRDSVSSTSSVTGATTSPSIGARTVSVGFDDPVGDATPGIGAGTPPSWTDLAGGSLERRGNAYRLTARLGGEAPKTGSGAETMNVASFYDTDGDGSVDYEIWVNLGPNGWGPVWYDDSGNAKPGESSNVNVVVAGNQVQLLFPDVMLDKPDRLRFSLASEYGPVAVLGSSSARRDDAPNRNQAVSFP